MAAISFIGVSGSKSAAVSAKLINQRGGQSIIVVPNANRAHALALDLSFFVSKDIYVMPQEESTLTFYDAKNKEDFFERLKILKEIQKATEANRDFVLVVPIFSAGKKLMPPEVFAKKRLPLAIGEEHEIKEIAKSLVQMGYKRVPMVHGKGQFALRGSIIDIATSYDENPYRIEFFDIEIENIKSFDIDSQRSIEKTDAVEIYPATAVLDDGKAFERAKSKIKENYKGISKRAQALCDSIDNFENGQQLEFYIDYFYERPATIFNYLKEPLAIVDDPIRIGESIEASLIEYKSDFMQLLKKEQVVKSDYDILSGEGANVIKKVLSQGESALLFPYKKEIEERSTFDKEIDVDIKGVLSFVGKLDVFAREIRKYIKRGYKATIVSTSEDRQNSIKDFLSREKITGDIRFCLGTLSAGMEFPTEKEVIITDNDIFGTHRQLKKRRRKFKNAEPIKTFAEIKVGDFVVHESYGIGKFVGIKQLAVADVKRDYIQVKYAGKDMLYVPVENMDMVQRYVGAEGITPKVSRLSGVEWKNTKAKAKEEIALMAKELIETSAQRKAEQGYAFGEDSVWQREFEDDFEFEETDDQLRCIEEIKADMQKPEAMDRLLCGDVGYGKTEVAARAIFKCISEGKQAAMLVPTTILANQQYNTLKERFEKFPFKVEMLSRFRTQAEQKKIVEDIKKGSVDFVIGTHRLLSDDIAFKDLGLLVVDEEQRFGVTHKEKIKKLKQNVDVLTLSATPIPRTLHMSLVGIKNMSIIEQPPEKRIPVQTYVTEEDDYLIRGAIEREVARGGQVFIVFNRVRGIQRLADRIQKLVPDKTIMVGHGQMSEKELEKVMMQFINGEADILVATTIIESGIDIPNVNTQIIIDADKFGLSQLYQLRGRVGRSSRLAYAYMMYRRDKILSEAAEKRLQTIKEFTEFGAGFKVAMRDLEIRGAGNILGTRQHGHMVNVGYELYCKLVEDAISALKGEIVKEDYEEVSIDIKVSAYIPQNYIDDEMTKLDVYKKIAFLSCKEEADDLKEELEDRFGAIPKETLNLFFVSLIKSLAQELEIRRVIEEGDKIRFVFADTSLKPIVVYKNRRIPLVQDIYEFLKAMHANKILK